MSQRGEFLDKSKFNREDLIYLAGLIDGDGCFLFTKRRQLNAQGQDQYMLKLQVHCIDEPLIDSLFAMFGGVKIVSKKTPPRRTLYGIEFTGNLLTEMCELLIPFLRLKKPHAENMLKMRRTYNGRGGRITVSDSMIAERIRCFAVSREINTHKPLNILPPCLPST